MKRWSRRSWRKGKGKGGTVELEWCVVGGGRLLDDGTELLLILRLLLRRLELGTPELELDLPLLLLLMVLRKPDLLLVLLHPMVLRLEGSLIVDCSECEIVGFLGLGWRGSGRKRSTWERVVLLDLEGSREVAAGVRMDSEMAVAVLVGDRRTAVAVDRVRGRKNLTSSLKG